MDVDCFVCKQTVRKDTLITHMNLHPEYIWRDMFRPFMNENGVYGLHSKTSLREAINVLESSSSYELDEDLYADFGSKQTFKSSATATKHIQKDPARHREKFVEMIKAGLNEQNLLGLLKWIVHIRGDAEEIRKNTAIRRKELEAEYEVKEKRFTEQFSEELREARRLTTRFKALMETDEFVEYQETRKLNSALREENRILKANIQAVTNDMLTYKPFYDNAESFNKSRLDTEQVEISYWEKARQDYEKKTKKYETDCEKKIRKAQQEAEEATEKIEKKLRKAKDEIKALKQELLTSALRAKAKASDSDSD